MAAGVATENILDAHINAIKVLQCIDKSGALLEAATLPIKSYLRSRPDTIRCVVKMLTQARLVPPTILCSGLAPCAVRSLIVPSPRRGRDNTEPPHRRTPAHTMAAAALKRAVLSKQLQTLLTAH